MDVDLINIIAQEHKRHIQEISRAKNEDELKTYFESRFVDYSVAVMEKYFDTIAKVYCKKNPYFHDYNKILISPEFTAKKNKKAYSDILSYAAIGIRKLLDIHRGKVILYKNYEEKPDLGLLSEWIYWANKDSSMMLIDLMPKVSKSKSKQPLNTIVGQIAVINPAGIKIIEGWDNYATNTEGKKAF